MFVNDVISNAGQHTTSIGSVLAFSHLIIAAGLPPFSGVQFQNHKAVLPLQSSIIFAEQRGKPVYNGPANV